jgi:ATP-dependent Clp protease ATP-binding subunit ClpA
MSDKNDFFFTFNNLKNQAIEKLNQKNRQNKEIPANTDSVNSRVANIQKTIDENIDMMTKRIEEMKFEPNTPPFIQNMVKDEAKEAENAKQDNTTQSAEGVKQSTNSEMVKQLKTSSENEKDPNAVAEEKKNVKLLDKSKIRTLKDSMLKRVFGQDPVIEEVVDVLKIAALNIKINKEKPAGNYLFAGPSGVGKTELAQTLADSLGVPILVVNMGEYGLEQDVTKLIGSAPGLVGYNEGGTLTNFVMANPACIILFDELEKAHRSVDKILLSIMDKGTATDNKGNQVSFKETIIISTSNLGADIEYIQGLDQAEKNKYRMEAIKEGLRPEIINRYDSVFHFFSLSKEIYQKVATKFLGSLNKSIQEEHGITLKTTDKIMDFIVESSYDPAMGGRPARRFIEKVVIKPLADYMLDENFEKAIKDNPEITLDLNKDGNVCFKGKNKKILGVLNNTKELVARTEEGKFTNKPRM